MFERGKTILDEGGGNAGGDRLHDRGRDQNAARFGEALKSGGDDKRLAILGKFVLEQDFPEMHANAQLESVKLGALAQSGLNA